MTFGDINGFSEPPTDWHTLAFNDSQWEWGPSGFGYGDDDDSTIVANGILSVISAIRLTLPIRAN
ncbi:MAG: hypothetical protein R3C26_10340 [Calditrichia bacterium]